MIWLDFVIWKTRTLMRMLTGDNTLLGTNTPHIAAMSIRARNIIILQVHGFWTATNVTFRSIITIVRTFVLVITVISWKKHELSEAFFSGQNVAPVITQHLSKLPHKILSSVRSTQSICSSHNFSGVRQIVPLSHKRDGY